MKQIELYRWWVDGRPWRKGRVLTKHLMTREDAAQQFPAGAEPEPSTREVRTVPEGPNEWTHTSGFLRGVEKLKPDGER